MTVLVYQKMNRKWREEVDRLKAEFPEVTFVEGEEESEARIAEGEVLLGGMMPRERLEKAVRLRLIIVPFAGISHMPLDLIRERGIRVANCHGNARDVAERATAMILAFYGRIIAYHEDLRDREQWHGFWVGKGLDDTWESLDGKRCAIVGAGAIGSELARMLGVFGVTSVGWRRTRIDPAPPGFERMVYDLDEAIDAGEIVAIALPSTPETKGLFDASRLARMKGKLLVNVGRGDIADEAALYEALRDGTLRGAAIDTWYSYPPGGVGAPANLPIHRLPNVVLSPHVGGFTRQSVSRNAEEACENVRRWLRGGELVVEADPARGY